jgi:hypothetical protein
MIGRPAIEPLLTPVGGHGFVGMAQLPVPAGALTIRSPTPGIVVNHAVVVKDNFGFPIGAGDDLRRLRLSGR